MSVLAISTTFILAGQKIEFFCVTGMILVFGLGLDYIIYKMENKESKAEAFAIGVSFLTTAISFGALILSTFEPIHRLGLSIFPGLVAAFVCTIL
jgi:predicted exporter